MSFIIKNQLSLNRSSFVIFFIIHIDKLCDNFTLLGFDIFQIPSIDSNSDAGDKPLDFRGNICFTDVLFNYPSRPSIPVSQKLVFYRPKFGAR